MQHPLEFLPQNLRKPFFYFFLVLTVVIFAVFNVLDQSTRTAAAPGGIVSFELARRADVSQRIVDSWDAAARLDAAFGLGFDYLFMPVYSLALSLGLLLGLENKQSLYRYLASFMGWGAFAAALFDAVENYALWHILINGAAFPYPQIAAFCATIKFTLLILGLAAIAAGNLFRK